MTLSNDDLKAIAHVVKESISDLEQDVASLKGDVSTLKDDVSTLKDKVSVLEDDVKFIKVVQLENNVIPRLSEIEDCYLSTYERYKEKNEQFDGAMADISVMKTTIEMHSSDIIKLKNTQQA